MELCWNDDPADRPVFGFIVDRLNGIKEMNQGTETTNFNSWRQSRSSSERARASFIVAVSDANPQATSGKRTYSTVSAR